MLFSDLINGMYISSASQSYLPQPPKQSLYRSMRIRERIKSISKIVDGEN